MYLLFLSTYDERGEGTSLRSEVGTARVTSHQKLRTWSKKLVERGLEARYTKKNEIK
jgi:hypothetical protein